MNAPHITPNPTTYVLAFAFELTRFMHPSVCLIRKKKPEWQAGHLNGVGGKCEDGEEPATAMSREFFEETGVKMAASEWLKFFTMRFGNGAVVHCYTAFLPDDQTPRTLEEEEVEMLMVGKLGRWFLNTPIIPNLNWLIPLAWHELHSEPGERMLIDG